MKRVVWNRLDARERSAVLQRPTQVTAPQTRAAVQDILAQVRAEGDEALFALGEQFDGVKLESLQVGPDEFAAAASSASTPPACRNPTPSTPPTACVANACTARSAAWACTCPRVRHRSLRRR